MQPNFNDQGSAIYVKRTENHDTHLVINSPETNNLPVGMTSPPASNSNQGNQVEDPQKPKHKITRILKAVFRKRYFKKKPTVTNIYVNGNIFIEGSKIEMDNNITNLKI